MLENRWLRTVVGVAVVGSFVFSAGAFLTTERTYMGYLARGEVSPTVTGYDFVESGGEPAVRVHVEVTNPTDGAITLERVGSVSATAPDREFPVGRVVDASFDERIPPGATESVPFLLRPTDNFAPLRQGLESGRVTVTGYISASIGEERFQVPIGDGGDR